MTVVLKEPKNEYVQNLLKFSKLLRNWTQMEHGLREYKCQMKCRQNPTNFDELKTNLDKITNVFNCTYAKFTRSCAKL